MSKQRNVIDLEGKVALVTGASRGIGREAAIRLAEAGARVAVGYRSNEAQAQELVRSIGENRAVSVRADMGNAEQVRQLVIDVTGRFGRIDILVNNAGAVTPNPLDGGDYEAWQRGWQRTFDVNLFGAANAAFLVIPGMRAAGGGKIINVASRSAFRGETELADYAAAKAGLVNLTRSLARSHAKDNIIATCVAPGFVETDMAAPFLARQRGELIAQVPTGRVGTVDDVAGVILFLASPMADYLAGATIDVNGGSYFH
jgi:3-oxoacyl-[acyl-carrier protein] reductase